MKYSLFKLRFPSGFHVSSGGFADESSEVIIHSDTLMSAIASMSAKLYTPDTVAELLMNSSISSAFPFWNNLLFFPKPITSVAKTDNPKHFKKVQYVDKELWNSLLNGETPNFQEDNVTSGCWSMQYSREKHGAKPLFSILEVPRITLDRITYSSSLFNFSEAHFAPDCGLFFLASFDNTEIEQKFRTSLRLLADEGIGADRTVGKGWFRLEETEVEIAHPVPDSAFLLLSLYSPTDEEISSLQTERGGYEILTRRGWSSAPDAATFRRQSVRMFAEGSVLHFSGEIPKGHNPIVLKKKSFDINHDIVRFGRALAIPYGGTTI